MRNLLIIMFMIVGILPIKAEDNDSIQNSSITFVGDPFYFYNINYSPEQMIDFIESHPELTLISSKQSVTNYDTNFISFSFRKNENDEWGADWLTIFPYTTFCTNLTFKNNHLVQILIKEKGDAPLSNRRDSAEKFFCDNIFKFEPQKNYKNNRNGFCIQYFYSWIKDGIKVTVRTDSWNNDKTGWFQIFIEPNH